MKVCLLFVTAVYLFTHTTQAHAGFISDLVSKVIGPDTQAAEVAPSLSETTHNSQTLPLPESSINPDLKSIKDEPVVTIVADEALSADSGPGTNETDLEKYSSTEKISVYVVKKGDTLEGIAKKLKISKDIIIASNATLKKSAVLKVGQSLAILAVKAPSKTESISKDITDKKKGSNTVEPAKEVKVTKKVVDIEPAKEIVKETVQTPVVLSTPVKVDNIVSAPVVEQAQTLQPQVVTTPVPVQSSVEPVVQTVAGTQVSSGQPDGTINGGYIWPFPKGTGRVSQGIHADQAYDFAAPKGTPIYAIQNGKVLIAHPTGYNGGYGRYVVIDFDDGRQAIFGHMSEVVATEGQVVKRGDVIGFVGSTGKSTGPHVHIGFHGSLSNPYIGLSVNSTDVEDHD